MRISLEFLLITALLPISAYAGMYGQPVLHLDATTFKSVMANEHAAMVAFVAPWCGHCKALGPEYTAAAQSLAPLIPFYAVDCDDQANRGLCAQFGVQGYPTIKGFPKAGKGAAKEFLGERKRGPLAEYAKGLVPDKVKKLRVQGDVEPVIEGFLQDRSELPHVLLVHPSVSSVPFMWKVLAHRLAAKVHLGFVRDSPSHKIISALGVYDSEDTTKDGARVVAWKQSADGTELVEYDGILKFNSLLEWIQSLISGSPLPPPGSSSGRSGDKPKPKPAQGETPGSSSGAGKNEAAIRRAKLEEAERRDQARREKAEAAARAHAETAEQAASPAEAAAEALPEEGVEDVVFEEESEGAAEPEPAGAAVQEGEYGGIVHEEL